MQKKLFAGLALGALLWVAAPAANAHEYQRGEDDMWLRYVAYALHPVGIAVEYGVLRPIHWVVSQKNADIIFGDEVSEDCTYDYFEWK